MTISITRSISRYFLGVSLIGAMVLNTGCNGGGGGSSAPPTTGHLQILLSDDPLAFQFDIVSEINVTIQKIDVHSADGLYQTVRTSPITVNLKNLQNGITSSVYDGALSPMVVDGVRLYLSSAYAVFKNGTSFPISVPASATLAGPGIELPLAPSSTVVIGSNLRVLVDFDMSNSFTPLVDSSNTLIGYDFVPTLRAIDLAQAGSVYGYVYSDNCSSTYLSDDWDVIQSLVKIVDSSGAVVATAVTDRSGYYKVIGLRPGVYTVQTPATSKPIPGLSFLLASYDAEISPTIFVSQGASFQQDLTLWWNNCTSSIPVANLYVSCDTSSNGYSFSASSRSSLTAQSNAVDQCKLDPDTSNSECAANVSCNDGTYFAPFVTCVTFSRGYTFSDSSRDAALASSHAVDQCKADPYTSNSECAANVSCY